MKMAIKILLILFPICFAVLSSQTVMDSDRAQYEGKTHTYEFRAPEGWILDIENAYRDGFTAAMCPEDEFYGNARTAIFVWVYLLDSTTFGEFISADSGFYANGTDKIEFIRSDTIYNSDSARTVIFETADPGVTYKIATVAYIDVGTEVVIYELDIDSRELYAEGESKFREALYNFRYIEAAKF